jgi:chromosome segregation ATPase
MRQVVRGFNRVIEPSFPDNDALPKKGEAEERFDKRFNEWYEDVRINLDRLQDQLTTFFQTDINDSIETQKQSTGEIFNNLNSNLVTNVQDLNDNIGNTQQDLASTQGNLASTQGDLSSTQQDLASTQQSLASTQQTLQAVIDNLYSV